MVPSLPPYELRHLKKFAYLILCSRPSSGALVTGKVSPTIAKLRLPDYLDFLMANVQLDIFTNVQIRIQDNLCVCVGGQITLPFPSGEMVVSFF